MRSWLQIAIVFTIVLLLAGLLASAVQKVRVAHTNTATHNNLKQIALAMANFNDTYRKLPPAFGVGGQHQNPRSLWIHLHPYIEADCVYRAFHNDEAVVAYIAPSDGSVDDRRGALSFAANLRIFAYETVGHSRATAAGEAFDPPHGTMSCGLSMKHLDAMRGTANLLMASTRHGVCGGRKTLYAADAHGDNLPRDAFPDGGLGGFMGAGAHARPATAAADIAAIFQLQPRDCLPDAGVFGHAFESFGLSVAMCDGSVHLFEPSMSPTVFGQALCPSPPGQPGPLE